ncbi:MAG: hypothetical protein ACLPID_11805 [Beijerinckiaceae bacterium]
MRVADESAVFAPPEGERDIVGGGSGLARIARLMSAARMSWAPIT